MAPLHHAAMKDYIETMEVLVSSGASVNIQNEVSLHTNSYHYFIIFMFLNENGHENADFLLFLQFFTIAAIITTQVAISEVLHQLSFMSDFLFDSILNLI